MIINPKETLKSNKDKITQLNKDIVIFKEKTIISKIIEIYREAYSQ